ncbi:MAG: hypothetical protein ACR2L4_04700 [Actinomycetota bacterium]
MTPEGPGTTTTAMLICLVCGRPIDLCEFCERIDCGTAICYRCLNLALGQAIAQPHQHGG